jgi:predicted SAM-dependent methyltransferase
MNMRCIFRERLNNLAFVVVPYRLFAALQNGFGLNLRFVAGLRAVARFLAEFRGYLRCNDNPHFVVRSVYMTPCLLDRTVATPLEPIYFYQDTWAAGKIFKLNPEHHYDVGSSAMTMGIISQFVPTTMIDIRPIELKLENLSFQEGSIVDLPFPDNSIESLSSLCVVEHIGLGRYGDSIDYWGSEKAIRELKRVLTPGGNLFLSIPIDGECRVYFNAHRVFTREYVLEFFEEFELVEEKYVYGTSLCSNYDKNLGFGTGLFHVRKSLK